MRAFLDLTDLAMSNDFAAIISATMAALLLLLIAEFQAGVRSNAAVARSLAEEYADAIKQSFLAFRSGVPLAPDDEERVERELQRYQQLRRTNQRHVVWQFPFAVAGMALVYGLARVILWAPHGEDDLSRGSSVAMTALIVTGASFVVIAAGFTARFWSAYNFAKLQTSIRLANQYQIADISELQETYRRWEKSRSDRPPLRGVLSLLTARVDMDQFLHRD
ncbi:hypothetical protein OG539_43560 [Actinacidiphila glaucinigra]|uniref:hypothetical protein n=1 Tax=Actinacidiphila glaucinigra TaxID=235986 RepID=UPI0032531D69